MFWVAAAGITLVVAATLWRAAVRARGDVQAAAGFDLGVYRDQLAEVERDIARGLLPEGEGARLRTEVSRRVLEADRGLRSGAASGVSRAGWGLAVVLGAAMVGSVALYERIGAPGYPDLPLAERMAASEERRQNRPDQAQAEAGVPQTVRSDVDPDFAILMDKLRAAVLARPDDVQGLTLLVRNEAALGNLRAAIVAQTGLIAAKGPQAVAADHAGLAELLILATGGYVSPEAEEELVRALSLDARETTARYYSGVMFAQVGRFDQTFVIWRALLAEGPPDAPWIAPIRDQMPEVAARAGVNYTLPDAIATAPRGPSMADVAAMSDLSVGDRQVMIAGMVDQLAARLASEGGSAEEWVQLISSLAVLGRLDQAREIYAEAQTVFAGRTVELSALREAAVLAGVVDGGTGE